jgi:hypothetical protein
VVVTVLVSVSVFVVNELVVVSVVLDSEEVTETEVTA